MPTDPTFPEFNTFDDSQVTSAWLQAVGVQDLPAGQASLSVLRTACSTPDVLDFLGQQLSQQLPTLPDAGAALEGFSQYVAHSRSPLALAGMLQRDHDFFANLLRLFASGPLPTEILLEDPDSLELLRITEGQPIERQILADDIGAEVSRASDAAHVGRLLRSFRRRETLRIIYGEVLRNPPLSRTTEQLSFVAQAILHAALLWTVRELRTRLPHPMIHGNLRARMAIIATGKFGGSELSYGNRLNLLFVHDPPEMAHGPVAEATEQFFQAWGTAIVEMLSRSGQHGPGYQVDVQHVGHADRLTASVNDALRYFDTDGQPWERMSLVKSQVVAGDTDLGSKYLEQLQPLLFRRVLTRTDITGLRMLKRKIERQAREAGDDRLNIRHGTGGIRDIEFVIEFLQLLNGATEPSIRVPNTLQAIEALERVGCLTMQERSTLSENYVMLRRIQHQIQILCGLDCDSLPDDPDIRRRIAAQLQFVTDRGSDVPGFDAALRELQDVNRGVLDHLLHDAFGDSESVAIETELVLDPAPSADQVATTFTQYGFADPAATLDAMHQLAHETIPFLSAPRCRHFLAAIAPKLLHQLSLTPDPAAALATLVAVTDSLGGKGALWELLSTSESALRMVVRLCAASPYLAGLLTSHPGMIDDLLDSLVLGRLPQMEELEKASRELCRGAEDIDPILRSFKNACHLRIGIRDILGKADITQTHAALAATAEACLRRAAEFEHEQLAQRFGDPIDLEGNPIQILMLGMGKLGAREPNYHSDLDVMFLYHADGQTQRRVGGPRSTTTNADFFNRLTQQMMGRFNADQAGGPLYDLDSRIRWSEGDPTAVSLTSFLKRYRYGTSRSEFWQRVALTKARVLSGDDAAQRLANDGLRELLTKVPWSEQDSAQLRELRDRGIQSASPENLKRGRGGTLDVELIVSGLQLKYAAQHPGILEPRTIAGLEKLHDADLIPAPDAAQLIDDYRMLRTVESNLRLLNTAARHELPSDESNLAKLAYLIGDITPAQLVQQCSQARSRNSERFEQLF
ncbi:[protein-PII] uridylyltransferase family protein [Roseimaritima ulvae]|uniref:Glutamate-ammonia-ligase adenylyltransferase n=1 Tax=Roseimaritima ulvae TaxID=980254 RepID=A0A5B9QQ84_9BACT|nr:hypothetical protein [Roseimaritima ulvae]QEG40069.1 Glutamate-ammonia-ligase adenylyltransferase [Roseimaritima ulvae]